MASATRDPVTHKRAAVEGGGLTGLAVVVAYFAGQVFPDMPEAVQLAIVGVIVTKGNLLMSRFRNRRHDGKPLLGIGLVLALTVGCANFDATGYLKLAEAEMATLSTLPADIKTERCDAHREAAKQLRDKDGKGKAFSGPLGSGRAIKTEADIHERQGYVCDRLVELQKSGALGPELAERTRVGWLRIYESGYRLLGGE